MPFSNRTEVDSTKNIVLKEYYNRKGNLKNEEGKKENRRCWRMFFFYDSKGKLKTEIWLIQT